MARVSRDKNGAGAVVEAVDGKEFAEAFTFGDAQKGGVGEVHRAVGIFAHKFADAGSVPGVERQQAQGAAFQHFPERFLSSRLIGEKVHGFGKRWPDGGHGFAKSFECGYAAGVVLVVGVD